MAGVVEHLLSKHEVLHSNPSTAKKRMLKCVEHLLKLYT
jgi:hypothetical protein